MSFGTRLQELRRRNGITQEAFAQQLNVSRQAVSKWESSRGYPEMEKLLYICTRYGVTMDELFVDELPSVQKGTAQTEQESLRGGPTLKWSLGNFFTNLSPKDQWMFGTMVSSVALVLVSLFFLLCTTMAKGASDGMTMKLAWLALLILFGVGEAITVGLTSAWFALGSLAALICTMLGGGLWLQIAVFIVVSAVTLALVRPLAKKYLAPAYSATNADRVVGQTAVVVQEIDNLNGQGQVTVAGQTWTARSEGGAVLAEGTRVRVLRIEGVKVFVAPIEG
jgi:membrane protein implicated in regulation of membrane protease activity/transcriptional regulator with XRE-family HTH domain